MTHAVPIFEGFALPHATVRLEVAGQDITHALKKKLAEKGQVVTVRAFTDHYLLPPLAARFGEM